MLAWLGCYSEAFRRLGGVPATVRIDNEKTAVVRGAGAWGVINPKGVVASGTVLFGSEAMTAKLEVVVDPAMGEEEALRMAR